MKDRTKWTAVTTMFVVGAGLVTWHLLRDPDSGYREEPEQEEVVTIDQIPEAVRATIKRESAGGVVEEIQKETEPGEVEYDVDIVKGGQKINLEIAENGTILERKVKKLKAKPSSPHS